MTAPVKPGDVLAGKYRVDRILGAGGMGVVVAAMHVELQQMVALKFMLPGALDDANRVARFLREARAAVRLRGEHVARVSDVGRLEDGAPYIVMEYLRGEDLGAVLDRRGALPLAEAVTYVMQACMAMAEAHAAGIVHRDLKPGNLFLTQRPDGRPLVKVLDFGISKVAPVAGETDAATTQTSTMMGSPAYMAPEQMRSAKHVDSRADVWSLGAILYHMVAGVLPFRADTAPEIFAKVLYEPLPPIRQSAPQLPPAFEEVLARCLAKEADQRTPSVAALARDLAPFADEAARGLAKLIATTAEEAGPAPMPAPSASAPAAPLPPTKYDDAQAVGPSAATVASPGRAAAAAAERRAPTGAITTTHRAASGEVAVQRPPDLDSGDAPSGGRGRQMALMSLLLLAALAGIVAVVAGSGDADRAAGDVEEPTVRPATAVVPASPTPAPSADAGPADSAPDIANAAPTMEPPPAAYDAGPAEVTAEPDAPAVGRGDAPASAAPAKKRKRRRPRRKSEAGTEQPAGKTADDKGAKDKAPADDDPFGTMQ